MDQRGRRRTNTGWNVAEYTIKHLGRGARFLEGYLGKLGMTKLAPVAARIVHFTGYERPINTIRLPNPIFTILGYMLGTADRCLNEYKETNSCGNPGVVIAVLGR